MLIFGILAYYSKATNQPYFTIIFFISIFIINPFIKVSLGRFNWNILDTIWAIILWYFTYKNDKLKTSI